MSMLFVSQMCKEKWGHFLFYLLSSNAIWQISWAKRNIQEYCVTLFSIWLEVLYVPPSLLNSHWIKKS